MDKYIFNLKIVGRFFSVDCQEWLMVEVVYNETSFDRMSEILSHWEFVFENNISIEISDIKVDLPF